MFGKIGSRRQFAPGKHWVCVLFHTTSLERRGANRRLWLAYRRQRESALIAGDRFHRSGESETLRRGAEVASPS